METTMEGLGCFRPEESKAPKVRVPVENARFLWLGA